MPKVRVQMQVVGFRQREKEDTETDEAYEKAMDEEVARGIGYNAGVNVQIQLFNDDDTPMNPKSPEYTKFKERVFRQLDGTNTTGLVGTKFGTFRLPYGEVKGEEAGRKQATLDAVDLGNMQLLGIPVSKSSEVITVLGNQVKSFLVHASGKPESQVSVDLVLLDQGGNEVKLTDKTSTLEDLYTKTPAQRMKASMSAAAAEAIGSAVGGVASLPGAVVTAARRGSKALKDSRLGQTVANAASHMSNDAKIAAVATAVGVKSLELRSKYADYDTWNRAMEDFISETLSTLGIDTEDARNIIKEWNDRETKPDDDSGLNIRYKAWVSSGAVEGSKEHDEEIRKALQARCIRTITAAMSKVLKESRKHKHSFR